MDSYVIRIYRRDLRKTRDLVGRVEIVAHEEERAFSSFEELRDILISSGKADGSGKKKTGVVKSNLKTRAGQIAKEATHGSGMTKIISRLQKNVK
jgi:hypothetical protein